MERKIIYIFLIIFNWRIIALQCCVGLCHTSAWISHRHAYDSPLWNLPLTSHPIPPLWTVTEHQVELSASFSKFPPVIYFIYGGICVSMRLSPFMPSSPLPTVATSQEQASLQVPAWPGHTVPAGSQWNVWYSQKRHCCFSTSRGRSLSESAKCCPNLHRGWAYFQDQTHTHKSK